MSAPKGLGKAVKDCITELRLSGHKIDVEIIAELIKSSGAPQFFRFSRMKDQNLRKEIQIILSSLGSMNDQMRKLYLDNSSINSTSKKLDNGISAEPENPSTGDSTKSVVSVINGEPEADVMTRRPNKRSRHSAKGHDASNLDLRMESRTRKNRVQDELPDSPSKTPKSKREFLPEVLPNFALDALGGVDQ